MYMCLEVDGTMYESVLIRIQYTHEPGASSSCPHSQRPFLTRSISTKSQKSAAVGYVMVSSWTPWTLDCARTLSLMRH